MQIIADNKTLFNLRLIKRYAGSRIRNSNQANIHLARLLIQVKTTEITHNSL